jgi:hypothetical protein
MDRIREIIIGIRMPASGYTYEDHSHSPHPDQPMSHLSLRPPPPKSAQLRRLLARELSTALRDARESLSPSARVRRLGERLAEIAPAPLPPLLEPSIFLHRDVAFEVAFATSRAYSRTQGRSPFPVADLLRDLVTSTTYGVVEIPVAEFDGVCASRSRTHRTLLDFAVADLSGRGSDDPRCETNEEAARTLASVLERVGSRAPGAAYRAWDGKLFWDYCDCSHRIAALHRFSRASRTDLRIACTLTEWRIDDAAVRKILAGWRIYILPARMREDLADVLYEFNERPGPGIREIGTYDPRDPWNPCSLIALPREAWYARVVSEMLDAHPTAAYDFTAHLVRCLASQETFVHLDGGGAGPVTRASITLYRKPEYGSASVAC